MLRMWRKIPVTISRRPERSILLLLENGANRVEMSTNVPNIIRNKPKYGGNFFIKTLILLQRYEILVFQVSGFRIFLYLCTRILQK